MCRMFFQCSTEPFTIEPTVMQKFISSCHWHYFRRYDLLGHHNLGFGFAYIPEGANYLVIKRDLTPIYHADWKGLLNIKTRFFLVHARKAKPWKKSVHDIHPISVKEKYLITHNGTIFNDSIPHLKDERLESIKKSTELDTRKYLCYIMDAWKNHEDLKTCLEEVLKNIKIGIAANAFLFNARECNVINYHATRFNGRHRTLFIHKKNNLLFVGTTPLKDGCYEIANRSLLRVNLANLAIKIQALNF